MSRRQRIRLSVGAGVTVTVLVIALLIASAMTANPAPSHSGAASAGDAIARANAGPGETTRSVAVGGVIWTVSRQVSPDGPCIGVVATVDGEEQGRLGGGCGTTDNGQLRWGIGGIGIGDGWFNVAYGEVDPAADSVRVTLGDGTVLEDTAVLEAQGLWIVIAPGDPTSLKSDFVRISALDATQSVIAQEIPPSLVAYRLQAQASAAAKGEGGGP